MINRTKEAVRALDKLNYHRMKKMIMSDPAENSSEAASDSDSITPYPDEDNQTPVCTLVLTDCLFANNFTHCYLIICTNYDNCFLMQTIHCHIAVYISIAPVTQNAIKIKIHCVNNYRIQTDNLYVFVKNTLLHPRSDLSHLSLL